MFDKVTKFLKKLIKSEEKEVPSKETAKERLHLVLMQDRANVSADFLELMKQEIIDVIKKYIDVEESAIDVRLTNEIAEDGTQGAPSLYANIPIIKIKNEVKADIKNENETNKNEKKIEKDKNSKKEDNKIIENEKKDKVEEKPKEETKKEDDKQSKQNINEEVQETEKKKENENNSGKKEELQLEENKEKEDKIPKESKSTENEKVNVEVK